MKISLPMGERHFKVSRTTLFFNTRDELIRIKLDRVVYFEADSNYCKIFFINGVKATLLTSLLNIEKLLIEIFKESEPIFIRIGKKYIVNKKYIFRINIPCQKLVFSDFNSPVCYEMSLSKEALKNLKQVYINNYGDNNR